MGTPNQAPLVVGIGEILWDLFPSGKQLGGAPANFAYHVRSHGIRAVPVSAVGKDALGDEIYQRLEELKLDKDYVFTDAQHPTGTVTVQVDTQGIPTYIIHKPVAWDFIPQGAALLDLARQADAVCFGTLALRSPVSRDTICGFIAATRKDCLRVFDINLRQEYFSKEIIERVLPLSDVLKLNDEELPVVAKLLKIDGQEQSILRTLLKRFDLKLIALTRGAKGSCLFGDGALSEIPAPALKVVDTVGAGDSFTAALVVGLLQGRPISQIHSDASRLAGYVCTQRGGTPPIAAGILANL